MSHQSSGAHTNLAAQVGFGLDIPATNRVRVRLAADYVKTLHFAPGTWDPRFGFLYGSAGVVIGLGSRSPAKLEARVAAPVDVPR